ncbi:MAG TPA: DUF2282 domain-containing protein [Steroidobacteraceae bacterium]|jgi:uncharacterized membrane protein|nr:DUF2282 domain-containing protein [Steroidobacteraceae bacterium]
MSTRSFGSAALISGAIAALLSNTTQAQVHPEKPTYKYEKCYGIARAGQNDCFFAGNSCAGTSSKDDDPQAWVYLPQGTCKKISGGTLEPPRK